MTADRKPKTEESPKGKRYWSAHARGCNFEQLRKLGFKTFYPLLDDYVFLEVAQQNEKFLRKQTELGISFLKKKGRPVEISQKEMDRMSFGGMVAVKVGDEVMIISGYGSNLEGTVVEEDLQNTNKLKVRCLGYKRVYEVIVDRMDVIPKTFDQKHRIQDSPIED